MDQQEDQGTERRTKRFVESRARNQNSFFHLQNCSFLVIFVSPIFGILKFIPRMQHFPTELVSSSFFVSASKNSTKNEFDSSNISNVLLVFFFSSLLIFFFFGFCFFFKVLPFTFIKGKLKKKDRVYKTLNWADFLYFLIIF